MHTYRVGDEVLLKPQSEYFQGAKIMTWPPTVLAQFTKFKIENFMGDYVWLVGRNFGDQHSPKTFGTGKILAKIQDIYINED